MYIYNVRGIQEREPKLRKGKEKFRNTETEMAMRQRSGGVSNTTRPRQTNRPSYEDFQPQFELKEEHEAHIIHVHIPGLLFFFQYF